MYHCDAHGDMMTTVTTITIAIKMMAIIMMRTMMYHCDPHGDDVIICCEVDEDDNVPLRRT